MPENAYTEQQLAALKKAVEKLSSKKREDREAAQSVLDGLGASRFDVLLALLRSEAQGRKKRRRFVLVGISGYILLSVLLVFLPLLFGKHPVLTLFNSLSGMTGVIACAMAVSAAQKNATSALSEYDDKRAVGWWAAALDYGDPSIVKTAVARLIQLLPQLNASDAPLLDAEQRTALYKSLNRNYGRANSPTALPLAILKALEQVGDEKAVPYVERLARGEGQAVQYPALQVAARECLPALQVRIEQNRTSQTLLRASSAAHAGSPATLLRPASASGDTGEAELLRAAESAEEDTPADTGIAARYALDAPESLQSAPAEQSATDPGTR